MGTLIDRGGLLHYYSMFSTKAQSPNLFVEPQG
jgi:hypothetical protein